MSPTISPPPLSPTEPVTEILHGVAVTDPYRWLEDQNSERTRRWLEEQTAYARTYFEALPGRDRIRKRVEELLAVESISEPWKVGNDYFYLKRAAHSQQPAIMMREGETGKEVVLVDPVKRDETATSAVRILDISRRGHLMAYGISHGGDPFHAAEFLDLKWKQVLPDRVPRGAGYGLVISSDERGFYYSHEIAGPCRPFYRAVYWHEFGSTRDKDLEIFFGGEDARLHVELSGSSDGRFLGYRVVSGFDPQSYTFYVQDMSCGKPPRKLLEQTGAFFIPCFVDSRVFALTDWEAPNRRVVAFDLSALEADDWVDVVPESQHRMTDFCVVDHRVFVVRVDTLSTRIEVFDEFGQRQKAVPCPPNGSVRLVRRNVRSDTLFYKFSSFNQPTTIFSWHPARAEHCTWAEPQVPFDPSLVEIKRAQYRSKDGTEIPISLVSQKGLETRRPVPTFLTAYGGFGGSRTPQFNAYSTLLIEKGFLYVVANLRGGGEHGAEWHRAAQRHRRQTAIDDFISAAEWLVAEGFTTANNIAIGGMSNGGLLVGAAMTQRPDLFRAVVCVGPILDMLRYHLFDYAYYFIDEFGSSVNEDDFRHLLEYSPYHRVKNDVPYPSTLIVSGDLDRTCNPMHARKMTARLQGATNSGHPILLNYTETWGHVPVQPLARRITALTDRLSFICHELSVNLEQESSLCVS